MSCEQMASLPAARLMAAAKSALTDCSNSARADLRIVRSSWVMRVEIDDTANSFRPSWGDLMCSGSGSICGGCAGIAPALCFGGDAFHQRDVLVAVFNPAQLVGLLHGRSEEHTSELQSLMLTS